MGSTEYKQPQIEGFEDATQCPVFETELTPLREHPEFGPAQQLVIDSFWKAIEERRG